MTPISNKQHAPRRALTIALVGVFLAATSPVGAHAQLGKLKAAVKKQITGKDAEKTPGDAAPSGTAVQITPERLDQFFAAVEPWMQKAEAYGSVLEQVKAYDGKKANYESCKQQVMTNPANARQGGDPKEIERSQQRAQQYLARSSEASQRGDTMTARLMSDSMMVEQDKGYLVMFPALKQCGSMPVKPSTPPPPRFEVTPEGQQAFTRNQLGFLRERLAAYRHLKSNRETDAIRRQFNGDEIAAFEGRQGQLDRFGAALELTSTRWRAWQDLPSW